MADSLPMYEKMGAFYLGRPWNAEKGETVDGPLLYDSQDLLTHAVCVGMTGSGKTGLCVSLLEEAAIDGVPALIIDPKGDMGNLLFTFPELSAGEFEPWVDPGEAERKGLSLAEFAAQQADLWRGGLAKWDQDGERIRRLRRAAEVTIYTPGSEAGVPISILGSLAAPKAEILEDSDLLGDRVETLATSLLGLLGIEADPLRSKEHILLSNLFADRWQVGQDLDLPGLIQLIQNPPFERVGVMNLDSFYPAKERFELAISINNLMASPGMAAWMKGEPLDIDRLLYTADGRPRLAVLSIAHLSEQERMFFVSLLLNETVGWMRGRTGTTSLRALLYMDEVFGYLPPVAEPPSKKPLLTLFKQARAYGLGVVLATQNPADLDYKALSNAGTWFLGRLQTERDKMRVLEGLEGASAAGGGKFDRQAMEQTLAGLGKRVFLLHNVHEEEPVLFHTRWAMSYLRGPVTRSEIKKLMAGRRSEEVESTAPPAAGRAGEPAARSAPVAVSPPPATLAAVARPVLPPGIAQRFLIEREVGQPQLRYEPALLGEARVHFADRKSGVQHVEEVYHLLPLSDAEADWYSAQDLSATGFEPDRDCLDDPLAGARFAPLPAAAGKERSYSSWRKHYADALYHQRRFELLKSPTFGAISEPGESERDFRIRLRDLARERRDEEKKRLRDKFASKLRTQEERVRKAEQKVERESEQAKSQKMQTWISVGATAMSALFVRGRASSVGRATTALRSATRGAKEKQDVARAEQDLQAQRQRLEELELKLEREIEEVAERFDPLAEELETAVLKPRRTDVQVKRVSLAWVPEGYQPS